MATGMLRSAVAGLALRRSATLRLPARTPLSPMSAVSFSSNSAGARFGKHRIDDDENNDESLAARRRRKQERQVISRSRAGDYGDSYWVMDGVWDYARSPRGSSTGQDSTTNSSSSSISTSRESNVSSPSSQDLKGSSWSWSSGDSSYSGGGDFLGD